MSFVHLHVHSPYSFLDGASKLDALIEEAALQGMPALALTDHNNVCGAVRFQKRCLAAGIKPVQGAEVTLEGDCHLTLLATGPAGYSNLCRILTAAHMGASGAYALQEGHDRHQPMAPLGAIAAGTKGLVALSGCRRGEVPSLLLRGKYAEAEAAARRYSAWFPGAFYLELTDERLPGEQTLHRRLAELGEHLGLPLVATGNVHYRTREEFYLHDLLTCVRTLTRLDEVHPQRRLNAEHYMKTAAVMGRRFRSHPAAVRNTLAIAEQCEPALNLQARLFPAFDRVPEGVSAAAYLRQITYEGALQRYGRITAEVRRRLEHELEIICKLGYEDYFLLVWDVARYARSRGIRCAGRGSAADSAVAYCLFITEVDSLGRGLLFERFMSLERAEKPDIDIDFDARHRDEVADYVYRRYGREYVASVCTYNTYHARSSIRDLGKAMGFAPEQIDFVAKRMPYFADADNIAELLGRIPELRQTGIPWHKFEQLMSACAALARFPRFMGTHLGGLVIAREPLLSVTPLQQSAKGVAVVQFDKEYVEDLGLIKLDLLSLRTLSAVSDTIQAVPGLDYDNLQPDDDETYAMLRTGETIGVFQLESPAQRALQARLGADRFEDIVASVAIIRPGPIQGNMVEPFLARRQGREEVSYLHPKLQPILAKTYGVVLFQEQVIEIATAIAGFSPGEADELRRVMTKARHKEDMIAIGRRFVEKSVTAGVDPAVADTIFSYIQGYASYGFCEAHAAAFGSTAYKTAYLVRHHPAEFFAALMSNQPMGYYPINTLAGEVGRRGVGLLPLDINRSRRNFTVEEWSPEAWAVFWAREYITPPWPELGKAVRVGLRAVKGMAESALAAIEEAQEGGEVRSLSDFALRTGGRVPRNILESLVLTGAFDMLSPNRRALLWQVPVVLEEARGERQAQSGIAIPESARSLADFRPEEKYLKEYELLSLMIRGHYMMYARERLKREGYLSAAQARVAEVGSLVRVAGVVIRPHRPPTRSGRIVVFLSLEDETGLIDVTIFEDAYQRYGHLVFTDPRPPLAVLGRVERRGNLTSVTAIKVKPLDD